MTKTAVILDTTWSLAPKAARRQDGFTVGRNVTWALLISTPKMETALTFEILVYEHQQKTTTCSLKIDCKINWHRREYKKNRLKRDHTDRTAG
jgi:hypothetical protein